MRRSGVSLIWGRRYSLFAVGILLAIVVISPVPSQSIGALAVHDFAHVPAFGLIALMLLLWLRARDSLEGLARQYTAAFAGACVLGGATELIQIPVGRDASWGDVASDALGALGFLASFAVIDRKISATIRASALAVALVALGVPARPVLQAALEYKERQRSFPVLFDATREYDDYFLGYHEASGRHVPVPAPFATMPDERALHLQFDATWAPMLILLEPYPDWSAYRQLAVDVTNTEPSPLTIRIGVQDRNYDESKKDRFVRSVTVPPNERLTVTMLLEDVAQGSGARPLDLRRIDRVIVFDEFAVSPRAFYVSRLWLE